MEKVNKALLNFLRMDFINVLTSFRDLIPEKYELDTYLPTRSLLDYILIRSQGLSKLMVRTAESCQISAYYLQNKILIGHFWKVAFIAFSLVSRIRMLSKEVARFTCEFYKKLKQFRNLLKDSRTQLLPDNYNLPNDLRTWLAAEWLFTDENNLQIQEPEIPKFEFDDSDVEISEEYINIDEEDVEIVKEYMQIDDNREIVSNNPIQNTEKHLDVIEMEKEDLGEKIVREVLDVSEEVPREKEHQKCDVNNIKNMKDLKIFFAKEKKLFETNKAASQFKNLDKLQWSMLKKLIEKFVMKSKKHTSNTSNVNHYLSKAKDAIRICLR